MISQGLRGGDGRNRTADTRIFSPLLYRLSYITSLICGGKDKHQFLSTSRFFLFFQIFFQTFRKVSNFATMNLVIDQGNTAIKLAIFDQTNLIEKVSIERNLNSEILEFYHKYELNLDKAIYSSVTNDEFPEINIPVLKFSTDTPLPIQNKYSTPKSLGKDRLANAVAVWFLNPHQNSLAIDMGTCIKYDIVSEKGEYLGGNISPGLEMRYKALNYFTDKLPLLSAKQDNFNYGIDTETSIFNGVQQGIYHEINGFIQRYKEQFGGLTIFMSGGSTIFFDKEFKNDIFANPNLTLIGLNQILMYNAE